MVWLISADAVLQPITLKWGIKVNKEKKLLDITKPEMHEVEEPLSYDPEVEKKRLEAYENIQKGWQEVANKGMDTLNEILKTGEKRGLIKLGILLGVVIIIFGCTAFLAYNKTISGEAFTFFVGTLVGYLLAYSLPRIEF